MDKKEIIKNQEEQIFPATVVKVVDEYRLAINKGTQQGIKNGQRLLIYELSEEEIIDPNSGKQLGKLEIVKGTGKVIHVQEKMSTVESDTKETDKRIIRRTLPWAFKPEEETVIAPYLLPFENPKVGDKAKPI